MRKIRPHWTATLLGLFALAACDESGTQLALDTLGVDEEAELAILGEPGALDVVELGDASNYLAANFGMGGVLAGRGLSGQAGARLASATEALRTGDRRRALDEAREARRLLARAIYATRGVEGVTALVEHLEELALSAAEDGEDFDDADGLAEKLSRLAAEARAQLGAGEYVRAAEIALLGEQSARHHRRHIAPERARLAVSLAHTAVALATRLVAGDSIPVRPVAATDVREHQNRWLWHARHMLEKDDQALANGNWARTIHFAEHAHWSALKAVILPGGVTEEELNAMVELAHRLYDAAVEDLGTDPSELEARLLERAERLIAAGEAMLAEGKKRGVAPVWRGAVISRWLMD
ncbi:MAG: hypothetical protein FJ207_06140 [Gemmatimonadetes bacterium]|nr:hypothetical protein [Gemmatimonadota bacterium]